MSVKYKILYDYLMPTQDTAEYFPLFLKSAKDHFIALKKAVEQLALQDDKAQLLETIYINSHSLKGSASVMGFTEIADNSEQIILLVKQKETFLQNLEGKTIEVSKLIDRIGNLVEILGKKSLKPIN